MKFSNETKIIIVCFADAFFMNPKKLNGKALSFIFLLMPKDLLRPLCIIILHIQLKLECTDTECISPLL